MNQSSKISPDGSIHLPAEVQRSLGVRPGDDVQFVRNAAGAFELRGGLRIPAAAPSGGSGLKHLKGLFAQPIGTLDVEAAIAETVRRRVAKDRSEMDP